MGLSVALLLSLSFTLVAVAGCGDDGPVRGAGRLTSPSRPGSSCRRRDCSTGQDRQPPQPREQLTDGRSEDLKYQLSLPFLVRIITPLFISRSLRIWTCAPKTSAFRVLDVEASR